MEDSKAFILVLRTDKKNPWLQLYAVLSIHSKCSIYQYSLRLPPAFTLVSCFAYYSTLKMDATCSSETSVDFQQTTRCYIPEDRTLHNHCCENLKSYSTLSVCWISGEAVGLTLELSMQSVRLLGEFVQCLYWCTDYSISDSLWGNIYLTLSHLLDELNYAICYCIRNIYWSAVLMHVLFHARQHLRSCQPFVELVEDVWCTYVRKLLIKNVR
jgi:hypothetical protein